MNRSIRATPFMPIEPIVGATGHEPIQPHDCVSADFSLKEFEQDRLHDECGVFGVFSDGTKDVARMAYYALYALQHRGQESAGIAVNDSGTIVYHKDMGLVPEVFDPVVLDHLKGSSAIGHVRYSTQGGSQRENAQPIVVKYRNGHIAMAHNGNLVNAGWLRRKLEDQGSIFQTTSDTETILNLTIRNLVTTDCIEEALLNALERARGSYSLVVLTGEKLMAVRDPLGIRPLCVGVLDGQYLVASETCGLDAVGASFIRDIEPGELVVINETGLLSYPRRLPETPSNRPKPGRLCVFEHIYFARPDSFIDGASVYRARIEAGKQLFELHPCEADMVIGVPDSGLTAALGFSQASGIPYGQGLIKNRYIGRTFIKPDQGQREDSVRIKLNAMKSEVEGKNLVLIDDSIVRGTTSKRIVQLLKEAGAKKVHFRVSSPPVKFSCHYGIDTPDPSKLMANGMSLEEMRQTLGVDSLGYLSIDGLQHTPVGSSLSFCDACFSGNYPVPILDAE
jgi:amidophosphoribosyltransferase